MQDPHVADKESPSARQVLGDFDYTIRLDDEEDLLLAQKVLELLSRRAFSLGGLAERLDVDREILRPVIAHLHDVGLVFYGHERLGYEPGRKLLYKLPEQKVGWAGMLTGCLFCSRSDLPHIAGGACVLCSTCPTAARREIVHAAVVACVERFAASTIMALASFSREEIERLYKTGDATDAEGAFFITLDRRSRQGWRPNYTDRLQLHEHLFKY